jgi:hypothetical protein
VREFDRPLVVNESIAVLLVLVAANLLFFSERTFFLVMPK